MSNLSFNEVYNNALPLIQANARLVYGRHRTYDVVIATKDNVHTAILIGYEQHTLSGIVLLRQEERSSDKKDDNFGDEKGEKPDDKKDDKSSAKKNQFQCQEMALNMVNEQLKGKLGRAMDRLEPGTKITEYGGIVLGEVGNDGT